jgi:hypothetical protein
MSRARRRKFIAASHRHRLRQSTYQTDAPFGEHSRLTSVGRPNYNSDEAWMINVFGSIRAICILAIERVYLPESNDPRDEPPVALEEKIACGESGVKTRENLSRPRMRVRGISHEQE